MSAQPNEVAGRDVGEPKSPGQGEPDVARILREFSATYSAELSSKMSRLDELVGRTHWLTVGSYKESILREHLRNKLPRKFEISTGFVLARIGDQKAISKQIDILVWDSTEHAPFFRDGEFVIIPPEACVGALEVKGTLSHEALEDGLVNLDSLTQFAPLVRAGRSYTIYTAIFAFSINEKLSFPNTVLNKLSKYYTNEAPIKLQERMNWSNKHDEFWLYPWINDIAVLTKGVAHLNRMDINGNACATYGIYETAGESINDTYGFIERNLALFATDNHQGRYMNHTKPGAHSVIFSIIPDLRALTKLLVMPPVPGEQFRSIGFLSPESVADLAKKVYMPRSDSA